MTQATLGFLGFDYGLNTASKSRFDGQVAALVRGIKPLDLTIRADARAAATVIRSLSAPVTKTLTLAVDPTSLAATRAALRGLGSGTTLTLRLDPAALTAVGGLTASLTGLNTTLTTLGGTLGSTTARTGAAGAATNTYAKAIQVLAAEEKAGILTGAQHLAQLQAMQAAMGREIITLQSLTSRTAAQTAELNTLRQSYANATSTGSRLRVEQSAEVQAAGALVARLRELTQQRQNGTLRNREYIFQAQQLRAQIQGEAQALATLSTRTAAQQRAYDLLSTAARNATAGINAASGANLRAANTGRMAAAAIGSGLVQSLTMTLGPGGMVIGMLGGLTAGMTGAGAAARLLTGLVGGVFIGLGAAAALGVKQNTELTTSYNVLRANSVEDIGAVDAALVKLRNTGGLVMQTFKRTELAQTTAELVKAGASVGAATTELATGAKLASAEQKDLSETTLSLHRNLTQFGKGAEYASTAGNMLAKASNLAFTDATGLSKGLNVVGATAKLAGFNFAQTLGALVELDNKGFDAADMGATGLRGAIAALADPTEKAQGLFAGMGIGLKNVDGTARNTRLVMKDLRDWIVAQGVSVNQNTKDLEGNAEALSKVSGIMDTRAAAAMLMLTEQWDKNTQQIENSSGFLDQYANTMSQGVGPAMKRLTATAAEFGTELTSGTMGGLNVLIDGLNRGLLTATAFARAWNDVNAAVGRGESWDAAVARYPQFAAGLNAIHTAQELVKGGVTWLDQNLPILTGVVGGLTVAWGLNFVAGGRLAALWATSLYPAIGRVTLGIQGATAASLRFLATPVGAFAVIAGAVAALALTWFNLRKEIDATYASIEQGQKDSDAALETSAQKAQARGDALGRQQAAVLRAMKALNEAQRDVVVGKDLWGNPRYAAKDQALIRQREADLARERAALERLRSQPQNQPEVLANQQASRLIAEQRRLNTELERAKAAGDTARMTRLNAQIATFAQKVESFRAESAINAAALKTLEDAQRPAGGQAAPPSYAAQQQALYRAATEAGRKLLAEQQRVSREIAAAQQRGDVATVRTLQVSLAAINGKIAQFKSASQVQKEAMAALTKTGGDSGNASAARAARTDAERIAWDKWVRSLKSASAADLRKAQSQAEVNKNYDAWRAIQTELDARAGRDAQAAQARAEALAREAEQVRTLTRESGQWVQDFARQVAGGDVSAEGLGTFTNRLEDLRAKLGELPESAQRGFGGLLGQAERLKGQAQALVNHAAAVEKLRVASGEWSSGQIQAALDRSKGDPAKQKVLGAALKEAQQRELAQFRDWVELAQGSGRGITLLTEALSRPLGGEQRKAAQEALRRLKAQELQNLKDWAAGAADSGQFAKLEAALARTSPGGEKYQVIKAALDKLRAQELAGLKGAVRGWSLTEVEEGLIRAQNDPAKLAVLRGRLDDLKEVEREVMREVSDTAAELARQGADAVVGAYEERKAGAGENLAALYELEVQSGQQVLAALNEQARLEREARDRRIQDDAEARRKKAAPLDLDAQAAVDRAEQAALDASRVQFENQRDKNQQTVDTRRLDARRKFMAAVREVEVSARREVLQNTVEVLRAQTTELESRLQDQVSAEGLSAQQRLDLWRQNSAALIRNKSEELAAIANLQRAEEQLRYAQEVASARAQGTLDAKTEVGKEDGSFYTVRELLLSQHTTRMQAITTNYGNDLRAYTVNLGKDLTKAEKDVYAERVDTVRAELDRLFAALDEGSGRVRSQLRLRLEVALAEFGALGVSGAAGVKLVEDALSRLAKADLNAARAVEHLLDPKKFAAYQAGQQLDLDQLAGKDTAAGARASAASPFEQKGAEIQADLDKLNDWWLGLSRTEQLAKEAGYLLANTYLQGLLGGVQTQAQQAGTRAADAFLMGANLRAAQANSKESGAALSALFAGGGGDFAAIEQHLSTLRAERDAAASLVSETLKKYGSGSAEYKKAAEAWVQAEQAASADLSGELDQRQGLYRQNAEALRRIQERTGVGTYQTYVAALQADREYHVQKVAWMTKTYGAQHAFTLKAQLDLASSTDALLEAVDAPSVALKEFKKQLATAEGVKDQPFSAEIQGLNDLRRRFPDLSREVDGLIARYERLRRTEVFRGKAEEVQKWAGVISGILNQFGTDQSRALGSIGDGVGSVAESAAKFAAGDIAGGITAAFAAVTKLGDGLLALDPAFKQWQENLKRVAALQEKALGGSSGALGNPFTERLKADLEARQQLLNASFLQRMWWTITGTTPAVLEDAAAEALTKAKETFDQLGENLTSTFENALMEAWSKGDLSGLQKAFESDLNKQIAQMVIHEAAQIVLASEKVQALVRRLGDAIKARDVAGIRDIGAELKTALSEGAAEIGGMLSSLPGFGLGAELGDLNTLLNQQYDLRVKIGVETDPVKKAKLQSDLTELGRQIKDLAFSNLGKNIFSGMRDAWKATLGDMLSAGNFSNFKTQMSQNMKKAVMGAIVDAVTASVDMAGTLQPIITRLVAAIRSGDKAGRAAAIGDLKGAIRGILDTTKTLFRDLNGIQKELGLDTGEGVQTTAKGQVEWDTPQMRLTLDGMALLARTLDTQIPAFGQGMEVFSAGTKLYDSATRLYDTATARLDAALTRLIPTFDSGVDRFGGHVDRFGTHIDRFGDFVRLLPADAAWTAKK